MPPTKITTRRARPPPLRPLRLVLLAAGAAALLSGLWTGLARLGVMLPGGALDITQFHGALMVCGFFGTLISLERAAALGRPSAYLAPASAAIGVVALFAGAVTISGGAFFAASVALTAASLAILRRQPALFTLMLSVAAASWGVGTLLWLADGSVPEATGWWLAFLVLTIAAERLELSRVVLPPPAARAVLAAAIATILIGVARGELVRPAAPFLGIGFTVCGAWLLVYDLARRTVRLTGQIRFGALCMLAGHFWLAVAGLELLLRPLNLAVFWYDAVVHAVTIGFTLSMVFGHALIILPPVTGISLRYSPAVYVSLLVLQLSVAVRVTADFAGWIELRIGSGFATIIALAGFVATLMIAAARNRSPL